LAALLFGSFIISTVITPLILRLAHHFRWYDRIDHRKIHTEDTPRLGGVGIVVSFTLTIVAALAVMYSTEHASFLPPSTLFSVLAGLGLIHLLGLYDDFKNLPAPFKFLIQLIAAGLPVAGGLTIQNLALPGIGNVTLSPAIAIPGTIFWIVAIANATNLIDGADGLAGGVASIAVFFMGVIAYSEGGLLAAVFATAMVGSIAGFLLYNIPPAQIFMGDGGSLSVGFLLAVIPLLGFSVENSPVVRIFPVLPVITILFIPLADTSMAIIRRLYRRKPVHSPDREHLHHRLIDIGFTGNRLLAAAYGTAAILGLASLSWFTLPVAISTGIMLSFWVLFLVAAILLGRYQRR
jgi:UDP-GlcNAc:undecaprenyl-phosphate GlcNAc-1-phosphate transferase